MKSFGTALLVLAAAASAVAQTCDGINCFNVPVGGYTNISAGSVVPLSWNATDGTTVTLVLKSGNEDDLDAGTTIASNITNSGSYTWTVASDTVEGDDYAVAIYDDQNNSLVNFTPQFSILSTILTSTTASGSTSTTSTSAAASSSGATTSATTTGSTTTTASGSTTSTGTSTSTTTSKTTGGATRATAMAGLLGAIALGALAL